MAFSEKIKKEARKLSDGKCVICKKEIALEIHHIIPKEENGEDTLENAAPLCANCHEIYGANPTKRKLIRDLRDNWYERVEKASHNIDELVDLHKNPNIEIESKIKIKARTKKETVIIYHIVYEHEKFEDAASTIFGLVSNSQKSSPGCKRTLYLDIEGHRNQEGEFDNDMFELQSKYMFEFLFKYLSKVYMPLGAFENKKKQRNDIPEKFYILDKNEDKQKFLNDIEGKIIYVKEN